MYGSELRAMPSETRTNSNVTSLNSTANLSTYSLFGSMFDDVHGLGDLVRDQTAGKTPTVQPAVT